MNTTKYWGPLLLALIALTALLHAAETASIKSLKAREAKTVFEAELKKTEDAYYERIQAARRTYRDSLVQAKAAVMKNGDLDDANAIQAQLKEIESQIKNPPVGIKSSRGLVIDRATYGLDNKWMDVTPIIRSQVADDTMSSLGRLPEPAFGRNKTIFIQGTYAGREFLLSFNGGDPGATLIFGKPPKDFVLPR
ncbi:MAG: hypothetical protein NTU53_20980 [Planctomycetota bacterium]|nr:hypothetical protein [Planctomycetota bacterium]